jgi:hydroxyacyl-ACP dehydratase HTD2-like protein with hotdog domain
MSLHTRCPQRIASTCAHGTVWRRRGIRYYASNTATDPEWFQQLRTELLSRNAIYQREDLDILHHEQLLSTLAGFVPRINKIDPDAKHHSPVAHLLTRFNIRVTSAKLLPDGTDPVHSPGEPWVRRMWAGGAVKLNPDRKFQYDGPFRLQSRVACVERIKDVRLLGGDDAAKIFVTTERRFASYNQLVARSKSQYRGLEEPRAYFLEQARDDVDWGDALLKEERTFVFLKAKTSAEIDAIQAGEIFVPRYITCMFTRPCH